MTHEEFSRIAIAMQTYYPRYPIMPTTAAVELWFAELQDLPYDLLATTLRTWAVTQKWPPTIADLRGLATRMTTGNPMSWGESWQCAMDAIRRYGSYEEAAALASMDSLTRQCVQAIGGYRYLCLSENMVADRAHYQKIYDITAKRDQERRQLPKELLSIIDALQLRDMDGSVPQIGDCNHLSVEGAPADTSPQSK